MEPGPPLSKKIKRKDKNKKGDEIDDLLTRNLKAIEKTCAGPEDEEELFGRHVAANLRCFTARQKAQVKIRIQSVLMDTISKAAICPTMLLPTTVNFVNTIITIIIIILLTIIIIIHQNI